MIITRTISIVLMCLINHVCFAQSKSGKARVIFSSSDIFSSKSDSLKLKQISIRKGTVKILYKKRKRLILPSDSVWGYQEKRGAVYRFYDDFEYRLVQAGKKVVIYSRSTGGRDPETTYYYSRTVNSKIHKVCCKNVIKYFGKNICMLKRMGELRWYEGPDDWDEKAGTIRFAAWYNECVEN